jgi:hypothetical protein
MLLYDRTSDSGENAGGGGGGVDPTLLKMSPGLGVEFFPAIIELEKEGRGGGVYREFE